MRSQWNVCAGNVLKHFPYCKTRKLQFLENIGGKVGRRFESLFGLNHLFELHRTITAFCRQIGQIMCYENCKANWWAVPGVSGV